MANNTVDPWLKSLELQDWIYQSFLILPTVAENIAAPGTSITAKKWGKGKMTLTYSNDGDDRFEGLLTFIPGIELDITLTILSGKGVIPAKFQSLGLGKNGATKGSIYELTGWIFPGKNGEVETARGSVRAVRGPDTNPEIELGKMPINTVGSFIITSHH